MLLIDLTKMYHELRHSEHLKIFFLRNLTYSKCDNYRFILSCWKIVQAIAPLTYYRVVVLSSCYRLLRCPLRTTKIFCQHLWYPSWWGSLWHSSLLKSACWNQLFPWFLCVERCFLRFFSRPFWIRIGIETQCWFDPLGSTHFAFLSRNLPRNSVSLVADAITLPTE